MYLLLGKTSGSVYILTHSELYLYNICIFMLVSLVAPARVAETELDPSLGWLAACALPWFLVLLTLQKR